MVPFGSTHTFGPAEDAKAVAAQLGVDAVVTGRFRVEGAQVGVDLTSWKTDGRKPRAIHRSASLDAVFTEIDALTLQLLDALDVAPTRALPRRNPRALEAYLKGQSFLEGWDVERNDVKAQDAFAAALQEDESFAEAHAGLSAALWRRYQQGGDTALVERALLEAQRAVSLAPELPEAHLALGIVFLGRGRSAEAAAAFAEARKLAPADDAACRQMARAYYSLKRNDEAEKLYQQAVDLRPGYWENYNAKASFYLRTGRHREAKELYAKVIELRPLSIAAYSNKAAVHMMDGEFKQAEPLLRAALQLGPSGQAQTNLGFVLFAQGRFEEAAAEYKSACETGVGPAETCGSLGDAYRHAGRPEEARAAYARATEQAEARLRINPEDAVLRAGLAWFLAGAGRCPQAIREATRAVGASPSEGTTHYYASVAFALCGQRAPAVRETMRALDRGVVADVRSNPDLKVVRSDPALARRLRADPIP